MQAPTEAQTVGARAWLALDRVLGVFIALLPARHREWYGKDSDLYPSAEVSGILQYAVCVVLLFARYYYSLNGTVDRLTAAAVARHGEEILNSPAVQIGAGFAGLTAYFAQPLTLFLVYLALEGLVRLLGAAVTHEVIGTLPLCLAARAHERLRQSRTASLLRAPR